MLYGTSSINWASIALMFALFFCFSSVTIASEVKVIFKLRNNHSHVKKENGSVSDTTNHNIMTFSYPGGVPSVKDGSLKGVVELGATGFNYFVIRINSAKKWEMVEKKFGWSLVYEHLAEEDETVKQLRAYIAEILNLGVSGRNIHFIVSSGALKDDKVKTIIKVLSNRMKYVVNTVTPEKEAAYAYKSIVPSDYDGMSFMLDMGSGNTKIGWKSKDTFTGLEADGSKYRELEMKDEDVYLNTTNKLKNMPKLNKSVCFVMGGVPFELAKQHRKSNERFTCLKSSNCYQSKGDKQAGGLNIYKAISDATGCKYFVFDWDANFAIGFLLSL